MLDSTGSMRETVGDDSKLDMAKRVMRGLMRDLAPATQVGLVVFGNRNQPCSDVPITVPLSPSSRVALERNVDGLQPKGTTPLAGTIRAAGDYLVANKLSATVILITDGEEQCDDDPLAAAKGLRAKGLDIVLHVIGLAVTETVRKELEEMAHLGGGTFYNARTENDFRKALREASAEKDFLRLSASVEHIVYSRAMYALRKDESMKLKFRPVQEVPGDGPHVVLVTIGSNEVGFSSTGGGWDLHVNLPVTHVPLPEGVKIARNDWNEWRIVKGETECEVFVNGVSVAKLKDADDASPVKVGVRGFDVDLAGVSVDLQPF